MSPPSYIAIDNHYILHSFTTWMTTIQRRRTLQMKYIIKLPHATQEWPVVIVTNCMQLLRHEDCEIPPLMYVIKVRSWHTSHFNTLRIWIVVDTKLPSYYSTCSKTADRNVTEPSLNPSVPRTNTWKSLGGVGWSLGFIGSKRTYARLGWLWVYIVTKI